MNKSEISRRNFLKTGALASGGLLIAFNIPNADRLSKLSGKNFSEEFKPNAFLSIQPDNSVKVILAHVEMGQGIWTTLPMLIANELDFDWSKVIVEHSPVDDAYKHTGYGLQITGGSTTTYTEFDRYRNAGAVARKMLVQAAAKRFNAEESQLHTENGYVFFGNTKLSYGELVSEASNLKIPKNVELKLKEEWNYIGKGRKRLDAPEKVNGTAILEQSTGKAGQFP